MKAELRESGIVAAPAIPWGTHLCLFYESKQDLLDAVIPYFKAGLESNEACLWVISRDVPLTKEEAWSLLEWHIPDVERYAAEGRIEVMPHESWFHPVGGFDTQQVIGVLQEKIRRALTAGRTGLRLNGGTGWLQKRGADDFRAFEAALDEAITGKPIVVLCSFPLANMSAAEILAATHTHGMALTRRKGRWELVESIEAPAHHRLTARQIEVLGWVARGKSAWEIGEILQITKRTVDEHVRGIVQKLGTANRTEAVAVALRDRIIDL